MSRKKAMILFLKLVSAAILRKSNKRFKNRFSKTIVTAIP